MAIFYTSLLHNYVAFLNTVDFDSANHLRLPQLSRYYGVQNAFWTP